MRFEQSSAFLNDFKKTGNEIFFSSLRILEKRRKKLYEFFFKANYFTELNLNHD